MILRSSHCLIIWVIYSKFLSPCSSTLKIGIPGPVFSLTRKMQVKNSTSCVTGLQTNLDAKLESSVSEFISVNRLYKPPKTQPWKLEPLSELAWIFPSMFFLKISPRFTPSLPIVFYFLEGRRMAMIEFVSWPESLIYWVHSKHLSSLLAHCHPGEHLA